MNFLNTGSSAATSASFAGVVASNSSPTSGTTSQKSFEQHLKNSIESSDEYSDSTLNNDDIEALADDIISNIEELIEKNSDEELSDEELSESIDDLITTLNLSDSAAEELKLALTDLTNDKLSAEELLTSIQESLNLDTVDESELSAMIEELKSSGITDKELLTKIEDFQKLLSSKEYSLNDLKAAWSSIADDNINSDTPELDEVLKSTDVKQTLVDMLSQLPQEQQEALAREFQQGSNKSIEQVKVSPNDLLMSIEKSNQLVNDKIDADADADADAEIDINADIDVGKNKSSNINEMISQLENSFKKTSTESTMTNLAAVDSTINVDGDGELQALKDLNNVQTNSIKSADAMPAKLTLNDSVVASQQLREHLIMMSKGGLGQAFMQLDPEELGAMSVRISMQNDQMNVQFQVQNSQAKDMLEEAMNKLKESLQEQGIALNQSDVEQQNQNKDQSDSPQNNLSRNEFGDFDSEDSEVLTLTLNKQASNGIDYYA